MSLSLYGVTDTLGLGADATDSGTTPVKNTADDGSSDNGSIWDSLLNNAGDIMVGGAKLINAFNGKAVGDTYVLADKSPRPPAAVAGNRQTIYIIGGVVVLLILLYLFKK